MLKMRAARRFVLTFGIVVACSLLLQGQSQGPQPMPMPPPVPAPRDVPYLGTIRLAVDATDLQHRLFSVRETIPARGGEPLVLLFPAWLPGNHSPTGRVDKLAGLM